MVKKVNVVFGGMVVANWLLLPTIATTYKEIADDNGLNMQGFSLQFEDVGGERTLRKVHFIYLKAGIPESGLQTFNDVWAGIAETYQIDRDTTSVEYYEE